MQWITEQWNKITQLITGITSTLEDLINRLNEITFDHETPLFYFFGQMRYLIGDTPYIVLISISYIGALILIYKLLIKVWNVISATNPWLSKQD